MRRRDFLIAGGAGAAGLVLSGCGVRRVASDFPRRRPANLVPVDASWDRVIRTTVGLRPHRESGFLIRADRLDEKTVVHNYGHGGAGMSLSWGTGALAADFALQHTERRAAVLGCGIVGLTTARQLQRRGFDVTIYAAALPPETTSNMSWASFTPTSGLISQRARTPEWDAQFRKAVEISYREHQLLVGDRYGVHWVDEYNASNSEGVVTRARREAAARAALRTGARAADSAAAGAAGAAQADDFDTLLPQGMELPRELLVEGAHPFGARYATRFPTLRFEPSVYLDTLMRDVITFGGRIVVRRFDTPRDISMLAENVVVNCTGLGSKTLFNDQQMVAIKGQLVVFVPQPEVTYATGNMLPRTDGIVLGHVMERDVWTLDINEEARTRVVEEAIRFFSAMRAPRSGGQTSAAPRQTGVQPSAVPPVEMFFGRQS